MCVSVCSGCRNKAPQTGWPTQGEFPLSQPETGGLRSGAAAWSVPGVPGEAHFPAGRRLPLPVSSHGEEGEDTLWCFFSQGRDPVASGLCPYSYI